VRDWPVVPPDRHHARGAQKHDAEHGSRPDSRVTQSNAPVETAEIALGTVGRGRSAVEGAETVPLSGDTERAEKDLAALGRCLVRQ
jgi:hypothetical protein